MSSAKKMLVLSTAVALFVTSYAYASSEKFYFRYGLGGNATSGSRAVDDSDNKDPDELSPLEIGPININFSVGQIVNEALKISGEKGDVVWSIANKPSWLNIENGVLNGVVPNVGSWTFMITATDSTKKVASRSFTIGASPTVGNIIRDELNPVPFVQNGQNYQYYTVTGLDLSNALLTVAGAPSDLTSRLDKSSGKILISGEPEASGQFAIDINVEDGKGGSAIFLDDLEVVGPVIVSGWPTYLYRGESFDFQLNAAGGNGPPYSFAVGEWPENGVHATISVSGRVSGTFDNLFRIPVAVTDGKGVKSDSFRTGQNAYGVKIYSMPSMQQGTIVMKGAVSPLDGCYISPKQFVGMNGLPPYIWSVDEDTLPPGTNVSADGVFEGTPIGTGQYNIKTTITDANGKMGNGIMYIHVQPKAAWAGCPEL